jgi:C4-dicarboxylate-binding protein DctP
MAGYQGEQSVHTRALRELQSGLNSELFACEITPDVTRDGHRAADLLTLTEQGNLEICYFAASYLSHLAAEIELWDLPFLISDRSDGYALFDGTVGATIRERLESGSGYRVLGCWDNGFRHLTSARKAIRSPSDCAGQRIRTMGDAPQHARIFEALGFTPVPLDVRELMPAIEAGTVDAQENPLTNIWNFRIYEHHRWITLTGHLFGPSLLLCNAAFYDGLTDDEQASLDKAAADATALQRQCAAAEDELIASRLTETDSELISLTPSELGLFKAAVQPVLDDVLTRHPQELTSMLPL